MLLTIKREEEDGTYNFIGACHYNIHTFSHE